MTDATATNPTPAATRSGERSPALLAGLAGLYLGYALGIAGATHLALTPEFDRITLRPGALVTLVLVAAAAGAMKSGWLADRTSRRTAIRTAAIIGIVGAGLGAAAPNSQLIVVGCAALAFAAGSHSAVAPITVAERSPRKRRGALVALVPLGAVVGLASAFLADRLLGAGGAWRLVFAVAALPAVGVLFVASNPIKSAPPERDPHPWQTTFGRPVRPVLTLAVVLALGQELTGIDVLVGRAHVLFTDASITPQHADVWSAITIGFFSLMAILLARHFIDHDGRKRLLRIGVITLTVSYVLLTLLALLKTDARGEFADYAALLVLWIGVFAFAFSLGSVGWVVISEIVPAPVRGMNAGFAYALRWLAALLVALTTTPISRALGDASVFALCAVATVGVMVILRRVPETNALRLPDIAELVTEPPADEAAFAVEPEPEVTAVELARPTPKGDPANN